MKGPGLFSDIGKKAKDLLNKDYTADQKLSISTNTASGVGLTSTAVKKGGLYNFEVGSLYKYKNTLVDLKVDTDSNISTTFTISEILPYTKTIASFKLPDYNSGKLEMQYFHDHASLAAVVALKQSPVVELSTTVGAHGMALGAEAAYDTSSGAFTKYTAGIGFNQRDYNASIIFADKGDTLKAAYVHHLDEKQKSSVVAEIVRQFSTNQNTFTVGGVYAIDPLTTVKAKLNNNGKIAALIQHNLITTTVTISSEFDTKALERTPKFGLALVLNLNKLSWMNRQYPHTSASRLADFLSFRKVRARLGGRVRLMVSGGAPLSPEIEEFSRVTSCAYFTQGYVSCQKSSSR